MDLVQNLEDNLATIFEVKGLLSQLNKLEEPDSINNFVLDFDPFLEQIAQVVNLKRESSSNLDQRTEVILPQWDLVSQSQIRIIEWEAKAKNKDRLIALEASIITWTQYMDKLQHNIEAAKKEKVDIDASNLASIKKKLVEETNVRIVHTKTTRDL